MWPFETRSTIIDDIGKAFWDATGKHAAAMLQLVHPTDFGKRNWDVLLPAYTEVVAFGLHFTSRMALGELGLQRRTIFMDAFLSIVERHTPPELEGRLQPLFNRRDPEYGAYKKIYAENDEPMRGTLMWEFARNMTPTLDPITLVHICFIGTKMIIALKSEYEKAKMFI